MKKYTISDFTFNTYRKEAKRDNDLEKEVLELKLSAMINNSILEKVILDKTIYSFSAFVMICDDKKSRVEMVYWKNDNHIGIHIPKFVLENLKNDYLELGLNKEGTKIAIENEKCKDDKSYISEEVVVDKWFKEEHELESK